MEEYTWYILLPILVIAKIGFWTCIIVRRCNSRPRTHGYIITNPTTTIVRQVVTNTGMPSHPQTGFENPNYTEGLPSYVTSVGQNRMQTTPVSPPAYEQVAAVAPPSYGHAVQSPEYVNQSDRKNLII